MAAATFVHRDTQATWQVAQHKTFLRWVNFVLSRFGFCLLKCCLNKNKQTNKQTNKQMTISTKLSQQQKKSLYRSNRSFIHPFLTSYSPRAENSAIPQIFNIDKDLADGVVLNTILQVLSDGKFNEKFNHQPSMKLIKISNLNSGLRFMKTSGIQLTNVGSLG